MRTRFGVVLILPLAIASGLGLAACADDDLTGITTDPDWLAPLRGFFERPDPVTTDAQGTAFFVEDGATIRYRIDVQDIDDVTLAHIHAGDAETAGPIVVTLFDAGDDPESFGDRGVLVEGSFTGADLEAGGGIASLDALIAAMQAATVYVNVHTAAHPTGEIRGQIQRIFPPD